MLKALIKSRFSALTASMTQAHKTNKKRSKVSPILMILLFVVLAAYFLFVMGGLFYGICLVSRATGSEWQVFLLATLLASCLCVFGSIFATKTQIFDSKDNELLLAMPIPPRYIFISRILTLLFVNYVLEAVVMIPCMVIYGIMCGYSPLGFVFALLVFLLIPFFTLSISTVVAWIVSMIASRMKNKNLITTVLLFAFFSLYMYGCFMLGYNSDAISSIDLSGFRGTPVFWWAADAVANGGGLSMLWFFLVSVIPALITYYVLDKTFVSIITTKKARARVEYRGNNAKAVGAYGALLKKELRRFFSSTAYLMNAGLGTVMTVVFAVMLVFNMKNLFSIADELAAIGLVNEVARVLPLIPAVVCIFAGSMNIITAPSISLEDNNLWILQSAPIDPRHIFLAKLSSHMIIVTPLTLISTLILCIAMNVGIVYSVLAVVACLAAISFGAYWGLLLGLKFPKFDWKNENVAVKQGTAVMGSLLGSMALSMVLCGLAVYCAFVLNEYLGFAILTVPYAAIAVIIHVYLMRGGVRTFNNLKK